MEKTNYYFDMQNWEINTDGRGKEVHPLLALMLAAMIGALFVVFIPFIGFAMVGQAITVKIIAAVKPHAGPAPLALGMSYLTGTPGEGEKSDELSELHEEVRKARETKE